MLNQLFRFCRDFQTVLDKGIKSIAVVLKHSAIYPDHEEAVGKLAKEMGFEQVPRPSHHLDIPLICPHSLYPATSCSCSP